MKTLLANRVFVKTISLCLPRLLSALLLCATSPAIAKTIHVTKKIDSQDGICDSDCSLREAINYVNSHKDLSHSTILNNSSDTSVHNASNCINNNNQLITRGLLLGSGNNLCAGELHIQDSEIYSRVLAPLAANNAALETHALLRLSPAVDAGIGSCSTFDQRRQPRPIDGDHNSVANCDLGAYERQAND